MRTLRLRPLASLCACAPLLAAGGCMWTVFDDLEADTWVTSVEKPDNPAASWGIGIARLARSGSGGSLAVLGTTSALYNDLIIDPNGGTKVTTELDLNQQFAISNLALEPLLLTSPDADEAALVSPFEVNRGLVIRASGGQLTQVPVIGAPQPTAATYMVFPPHMPNEPDPKLQVLVAQNDSVFGAFFDQAKLPAMTPHKCILRDDVLPPRTITIRALGAYRPTGAMFDDVLVLSESGKLMAYPGSVALGVLGCPSTNATPKMGFVKDLEFPGVQGSSQILVFSDGAGGTYALLQMHTDGIKGRLELYRITDSGFEAIGTPRELEGLRTAALFQPTPNVQQRYVIAGLPTADVDGVAAGQVQVFEINTTSGIAAEPALTLADAKPEDTQVFGRSVAALPYNDKTIIAVAADNEIFLYFRTNLYDETREGR
jgi:hypothetical protein